MKHSLNDNNIILTPPKKRPLFKTNPRLKHDVQQNKKIVKILNTKMFKGYRQILKKQNPNFNMTRFMKNLPLNYYPIEEHYNIYYKEKYLSDLNPNYNFGNSFTINKCTNSSSSTTTNPPSLTPLSSIQHRFSKCSQTLLQHQQSFDNSISSCNNSNNNNKPYSPLMKLFLNENEKQIYSNLPFLMLRKVEDPLNVMNNNHKSLKRSFSDLYCVKKREEIEKKNELARRKFVESQTSFLYHLSHSKQYTPSQYNFKFNKGLYHNRTISDFYMKQKENQNNMNVYNTNHSDDVVNSTCDKYSYNSKEILYETNPLLKIELLTNNDSKRNDSSNNNNKVNHVKTYHERKEEMIRKSFESLYSSFKNLNEEFEKEIENDNVVPPPTTTPIEQQQVNNNNNNNNKRNENEIESVLITNQPHIRKANINVNVNSSNNNNNEQQLQNKKDKFQLMKTSMFGLTKSSYYSQEADISLNNDLYDINKVHINKRPQRNTFLISPRSNLLKKYIHNNMNSYEKESMMKDRMLVDIMSKYCTKHEVEKAVGGVEGKNREFVKYALKRLNNKERARNYS